MPATPPTPRPARTLYTRACVGLAAATVLGLAVVSAPAPARAETITFDDRRGETADRYRPDLTSVSVRHSVRQVRVRIRGTEDGGWDEGYLIHVDTDGDRRPERVVEVYMEAPHRKLPVRVFTASAFSRTGYPGGRQLCFREDGDLHQRPGPVLTVVVPRRCLGNPDRVRVNVKLYDDQGTVLDAAPDGNRWGPVVGAGPR